MKTLITIIANILSKDSPKLLGRWNLDYCPKSLDLKVSLTNEDHCGPCGQYNVPKNKEKEREKIIDIE